MPAITLAERQVINRKLKKNGFAGLDDPNILHQIATLYRDHNSFRGLLMSTHPDQRRIAYESLRNKLSFVPKPLEEYEREIKERAEHEQWDVWNGTAYPDKFKAGEIESDEFKLARQAREAIEQTAHEGKGGVMELVCTKCTVAEYFPAADRKQAAKSAHAAGWRSDERNGTKRAFCPKHVPGRLTATILCASCYREQKMRAWDEQDLYAAARLAGWTIADVCTCPQCVVKPAPAIQ